LTAALKIISFPLEIPPLMPPELFVSVFPVPSTKGSLWADPFIEAAEKPAPNSIPFIAGIEKTI